MKLDQALQHYGSQTALAKALRITKAAVSLWAQDGKIPELRQYQIEALTKGKLKAERRA